MHTPCNLLMTFRKQSITDCHQLKLTLQNLNQEQSIEHMVLYQPDVTTERAKYDQTKIYKKLL